jgi:5'(3')-deoxyribonucleotidase
LKAKANGDAEAIKEATEDYLTSPAGIDQLKQAGKAKLAAQYAQKRESMILAAKSLTSEKIKLGIDIDNTMGDFTRGFYEYMIKREGCTPKEALKYTLELPNYSFIKSGWFQSKEEFLKNFMGAEEDGVYKKMLAYPKAVETLRKLSAAKNVEVNFVTARDSKWNADTIQWLKDNGISYNSLIHTDNKETTDMDVYIDDANYQLEKLQAHGKKVIAFDQSYNGELADMPRAKSWDDVMALLEDVTGQKIDQKAPPKKRLTATSGR